MSSCCSVSEQSSTGQHSRHLIRICEDIIGRAGDAGCAGDAAQSKDGHALDIHRQMHAVHQPRIDGWSCNAGDRDKKDRAQIRRRKSRPRERATERFLSEILRDLDPMVIGCAPAREAGVLFHRQSQMTRLDAYARLQPLQEHGVIHLGAPMVLQRLQQDALIIFVLVGVRSQRRRWS